MSDLRSKLLLKGGIVLAGAMLLTSVLLLRSGPERPAPSPVKREAKPVRDPLYAAPAYVPPPVEAPIAPPEAAKTARAMDASGARQLLRILAEAAASGNDALKSRMLEALGKHPSPRPVIEEELAKSPPAAVRSAYEEALARCR